MAGDVAKMIAVGLIWGITNSLMRRGAVLWDQKLKSSPPGRHRGLAGHLRRWADLAAIWQYSVPFLVNLSASAAFFYILGGAPISVAVPVTNATTFAATAASAIALGEEMRVGPSMLGIPSLFQCQILERRSRVSQFEKNCLLYIIEAM